jgi:hypothetical protein
MTYFTRTELAAALHELGHLALDSGKIIDLALYGGSCLTLVSNFRVGSEDVDAVAIVDQDFIDRAARTVAGRHGWPRDWINDGVRTYLSPAVAAMSPMSCSPLTRTSPGPDCASMFPTPITCWR